MTQSIVHIDDLAALQQQLASWRRDGKVIGLVPTMGNLHAGHQSLVRAAKAQCDVVLATIFVNPLQFGPNEDFGRYPRTLGSDLSALEAVGCDAVFTPAVEVIYPAGAQKQTTISVPALSALYCGQSRPGHFDGVCTIVCKLFNLTQADMAFFGLKDFQQFYLIRRMVADLQIPIKLIGMPTVREMSGLAMSSRNGYLSIAERDQASALYNLLQHIAGLILRGERDFAALEQQAKLSLTQSGFRPDYFHAVDQLTLLPATTDSQQLVLLAAAYMGNTRLIDNLTLDL